MCLIDFSLFIPILFRSQGWLVKKTVLVIVIIFRNTIWASSNITCFVIDAQAKLSSFRNVEKS